MKLVSIIIPVYNGEPFIRYSIQSIINQSYKDIQVIAVDDGSSDRSLDLLEKLKCENALDIIICHQENCGIAKTRNKGIELSEGKYLIFMDQDDIIEPDYVKSLVNAANAYDADIVVSGYKRSEFNQKIKKVVSLNDHSWSKFLNVAPWGKIFKKNFVVENKLKFLNVIKGEDCYFTIMAYSLTKRIKIIPYVGYNWIINRKSVSNTVYTKINSESSIKILLQQLDHDLQKKNKYLSDNEIEYYYIKSIIYDLLISCKKSEKGDIKDLYADLFLWLYQVKPDYKKNKYISPFKPIGEQRTTSIIVYVFMLLHKCNLCLPFLYLYSKV